MLEMQEKGLAKKLFHKSPGKATILNAVIFFSLLIHSTHNKVLTVYLFTERLKQMYTHIQVQSKTNRMVTS